MRTRIKFIGGDFDNKKLDSADPRDRKEIEAILWMTENGQIETHCRTGRAIIDPKNKRRRKPDVRLLNYKVTHRVEKDVLWLTLQIVDPPL